MGSEEEANFTRLSRLLVDKGTEALRHTLNAIHPPANLSTVLNANRKSLLRLKFKVINDHQWDLLFPASGNPPDSKTFDVTLLTVLLRNISGLPCPATGWNTMPPDSDRSTEANIARIKQLRNQVYAHAVSAQVDNAAFEKLWKDVSQALVDLKIPQKEIDDLKSCPLGPEEKIYVQRLKEWFQREEDLKGMLDDIRSDFKTMRQEIQDERDGKVELELLQKLAKHNFNSKIRRKVKMLHRGTRDWLLEEVEKWFTDEDSSTLMLIKAGPGFGKSVFAAKVCKIFEERKKLAAYHFCDFNNSNLKDPMQMLQSLASHMCDNVPGFRNILLDQLKRPHKINGLHDAFHVYLQNPLDELEVEPALIVIDGLDESATDDKNEMLKVIADYFPDLPKCVKVLVTSRPELSLQSLRHAETIEINATDEKNCSDLLEYLKVCLPEFVVEDAEDLSTTQCHDMDVPNIAVLPAIVEKCEGSFLYAYHIQQELRKRNNLHTMTYEEIMRFLPKGLDSVYRSYFNRLESELEGLMKRKPDLYKLLEMLVATKRSLPLGFIARALDLDLDCRETKRVISEVNEAVSCLLYVSDDLVTVFHKSVYDWLLATGYDDHEYTVKVSDGERSMWLICEQIFKELKKDASSWAPRNLTSGVRHALEFGFRYLLETCLTDNGMIDSSSSWFVDMIVIHYITVTVDLPTSFFSIHKTWGDVLQHRSDPILKFSQILRERISWHYLLADEFGRITDYLENVLYRSPEGLFTDDEKRIARELIARAHRPPMPVLTTVSKHSPLVKTFDGRKEITAIGVSSNKKLVAVALQERVILILSLPDLCELWKCSIKYDDIFRCCIFAPDDSFILFGKLETVLDVRKRAETSYFSDNKETFSTCAFSPSGNRLVTVTHQCKWASQINLALYRQCECSDDCFLKLWDVITHCSLMVFRIDVYVDVCCFSTTGFFIIVHCSKNDAYCVWNSITLQRVDQRKLPVSRFNDKRGKRRSEKCDRCVCRQSKDLIPYETLEDDIQIEVIYYGIYNGMECVFHLYPRLIRVIERTHFTSVSAWDKFLLRLESFGGAAIASGDEYFLLSCFRELFLFKFKRVPTMQVQSSPSPRKRVIWCAFSPDGTRLATCTSDGLVNIWNVDTCHVYQRFKDNIGTVKVACCWLFEYLFVCHVSDGILSLSKYPVDANVKVLFAQKHVVYICVVLNRSQTSTILDFSEGYLYFKHGSYPVKFLDVRRPEQGCSVLNLPKYKPGMEIKVLNDSFLSGTDDERFCLWKRNEGHPAIYEIVSKVDLDGWLPVYCFSDDLKYLVVSRSQGFIVVDVFGPRSKTVQKTDCWIKAWFVDKVVIALIRDKGLGIFDWSTGEYRIVPYPFLLDYDSAQASKLSPRKNVLAVPDVFGDVLFFQLRSVKEYSKSTQSKDRH